MNRRHEDFQCFPDTPPVELTEAVRTLPEDWQAISQHMHVLEGTWELRSLRPQEQMKFRWVEPELDFG
ncbi:MAG: hypothetical protein F6J95_020350 [Leptolyngbya sp. SIO1E4]|nr:hypothetical protein [Leptolyngbya sp. SIO1E4]